MSKKDLYRLEEERSLDEIADLLERTARELRKGQISFSGEITLQVPGRITLDIDVDQRMKKEVTATSVEIELKWAEES